MERNRGSRPENPTNRQRAKRKAEQQKARRKTMTRRLFIAGGISAVVLAAGGIVYEFQQGEDNSISIGDSTPVNLDVQHPLRELTAEHTSEIALEAVQDYSRLTGVGIDQQAFLNALAFAPNYSKMTATEREKYCGVPKNPLPCQEATAVTTLDDKVIVYKDQVDALFPSRVSDIELNRKKRDEAVYWIVAHEISHWKSTDYPLSDELYALVQKYFGDTIPQVKDTVTYGKGLVEGAMINFQKNVGLGDILIFRGTEEAEAETIARFVLQNTRETVYGKLENPDDTYFVQQRKMMEDLLRKLSPDYATSIKLLAGLRVKEGGREELFNIVGSKFGSAETALEDGFKIFYAINNGDIIEYQNLTK